jgi:LmbE family N-acetylglucosaminyl deacetylase
MLLLVSHSDDDQLFFAGLLPLYAGENGAKVQVAYFTNHNDVANRRHELLDGLWHTGVRNYPIIASFPDLYSESLEGALDVYESYGGYTQDDFNGFVYDLIQETRPLVVVTHDIDGEYGHGTHILCTSATIDAISKCSVPDGYGDIDGKWHVAKLYLHLYGENRLTLDIDKPLSAFDGKTAFKVSQEAFGYHLSQHWTWFYGWLYGKNGAEITLSTEITTHSPREYGLYFSAVGMDTTHTDMLENIETLAKRAERLEAESKADETSAPATEPPGTEATDAPATELQTDIATEHSPGTTVTSDVQTTTAPVRTPSKTDNEINKTAVVAIALAAVLCSVVLLVINAKSSRYSRYSRKPNSRRR